MDLVLVVGDLGGTVPAGVVVGLTFGQWENRAAQLEDMGSDPWKAEPDKKNPKAPLTAKRVDKTDASRRRLFKGKASLSFKKAEELEVEPDGLAKVSRVNFENLTANEQASKFKAEMLKSQAAEKTAHAAKIDAENAAKAAAKQAAKPQTADAHSISKTGKK